MPRIYSKYAIDYLKGIDIYDPLTKKIYTQKEAQILPKTIKIRLINKPRKIGCYVEDIKR